MLNWIQCPVPAETSHRYFIDSLIPCSCYWLNAFLPSSTKSLQRIVHICSPSVHTFQSLFHSPKPHFCPNSPLKVVALHNDFLVTTNRHGFTFRHLILSVPFDVFLSLAGVVPAALALLLVPCGCSFFDSWGLPSGRWCSQPPGHLLPGEPRHSRAVNHGSKLKSSKSPSPYSPIRFTYTQLPAGYLHLEVPR